MPQNTAFAISLDVFRHVKLLGEVMPTARSEQAVNDRMMLIEELRRLRGRFDRAKLSRRIIESSMKKMLRIQD